MPSRTGSLTAVLQPGSFLPVIRLFSPRQQTSPKVAALKNCWRSARPRLPPELLDHILKLNVQEAVSFSVVESASLVCWHFRRTVLRAFFTCLNVMRRERFQQLMKMDAIGPWTHHLEISCGVALASGRAFKVLSNLKSVNVSFAEDTYSAKFDSCHALLGHLSSSSKTLTRLSFTHLFGIDIVVLSDIASYFPFLTFLSLGVVENLDYGCCFLCFEESAYIDHSPIPDSYSSADSLARAFSKALSPLMRLKILHLGIFLSDEEIQFEHAAHTDDDIDFASLPIEECGHCFIDHSDETRLRELSATLIFAKRLPRLDVVRWASCFGRKEREIAERQVMVGIARTDGRIRVRRL